MLSISIVDFKTHTIPDLLILAILPVSIVSGFHSAVFIPLALLILTAALSALYNTNMPIGMGDFKMLAAIGLVSGGKCLLVTIMLASRISGIVCALLLLLKKINKKDRIAFGPYIAIAYCYYLLFI